MSWQPRAKTCALSTGNHGIAISTGHPSQHVHYTTPSAITASTGTKPVGVIYFTDIIILKKQNVEVNHSAWFGLFYRFPIVTVPQTMYYSILFVRFVILFFANPDTPTTLSYFLPQLHESQNLVQIHRRS